jgi:hypothetical protein
MVVVAMRGIDFESLAYGLLPPPTMVTPHHPASPQYAYNKMLWNQNFILPFHSVFCELMP